VNLRHAAALALVGWYLMYPPVTPAGKSLTDAPLTEWKSGASFDTAKDCETARAHMRKASKDLRNATPRGYQEGLDFAESIGDGQCVATDDPRLKEK
jgi:hypothetical protein